MGGTARLGRHLDWQTKRDTLRDFLIVIPRLYGPRDRSNRAAHPLCLGWRVNGRKRALTWRAVSFRHNRWLKERSVSLRIRGFRFD